MSKDKIIDIQEVLAERQYRPDEKLRSQMVDVFKGYFATSTEDGFPNEFAIYCTLLALEEAANEAWNPDAFNNAIIKYLTEHHADYIKAVIDHRAGKS